MITSNGQAIRFPVAELRSASRTSGGVRGIKLAKGGKVVVAGGRHAGPRAVQHHRERLRQAHAVRRVSASPPRRPGRAQLRRSRQKTGTVVASRTVNAAHGADRHQPGRHRHPHAHGQHPHDRPLGAGRLRHQRRRGRYRRIARDDRDGRDKPVATTAPQARRAEPRSDAPIAGDATTSRAPPKKRTPKKPDPIRGRRARRAQAPRAAAEARRRRAARKARIEAARREEARREAELAAQQR